MAKQGESRLQRNIRAALEVTFPGSVWWKVHGGPYQPAGTPDLMGCLDGLYVSLEVKTPEGNLSRIQVVMIERLRRAGALVAVVTSVDEAIDAVRGLGKFKPKRAYTGARAELLYTTWWMMLRRCLNPKHEAYYRYGGRGILVHWPWTIRHQSHGFWSFRNWVLDNLGNRPIGKELDRIDNDGSYEPGNLRWATPAQNAQNSSMAKLTDEQVDQIRKRYQKGGSGRRGVKGAVTADELAREFGVSRRHISKIISGDRW